MFRHGVAPPGKRRRDAAAIGGSLAYRPNAVTALRATASPLAVVLAVVPVIFAWRAARFYRPGVLVAGSSAIAVVAGVWFIGRALGLGLR